MTFVHENKKKNNCNKMKCRKLNQRENECVVRRACVWLCVFLQRERKNEEACAVLKQNFKQFGSSCLKLFGDMDL